VFGGASGSGRLLLGSESVLVGDFELSYDLDQTNGTIVRFRAPGLGLEMTHSEATGTGLGGRWGRVLSFDVLAAQSPRLGGRHDVGGGFAG
jgi:hypothetical protein